MKVIIGVMMDNWYFKLTVWTIKTYQIDFCKTCAQL